MSEFTISFRCSACDEKLDVELRSGAFWAGHHECFGESAGYIGEAPSNESEPLRARDGIRIEVEP